MAYKDWDLKIITFSPLKPIHLRGPMGVYRKGRTYELYTSRKFPVPKINALELGRPDVPLCAGQSPISMTLYTSLKMSHCPALLLTLRLDFFWKCVFYNLAFIK